MEVRRVDPPGRRGDARLALVGVEYTDGEPETYALPLAFATASRPRRWSATGGRRCSSRLRSDAPEGTGVLYDALWDPGFAARAARGDRPAPPLQGERRRAGAGRHCRRRRSATGSASEAAPEPAILQGEQSNTSVRFGDRFVLKLFRRLEEGINPDLEVGRFLAERTTFRHAAPVAGWLEVRNGREPLTLGVLHGLRPQRGGRLELHARHPGPLLRARADAPRAITRSPLRRAEPLSSWPAGTCPRRRASAIGIYLQSAQLLGQRTAELHLALASRPDEPDFAPEPFTLLYQRSLYQSMRTLAGRTFQLLRQRLGDLPEAVRPEAEALLAAQGRVIERFGALLGAKVSATRIRCHGDYHLGQVLYTGKDFVILDFEGEPARPLSERRMKRSPLRDVAGMLRSFHYAAYARLYEESEAGLVQPGALPALESWALDWERWTSATFLQAYLDRAWGASFVPPSREELAMLIDVYLLEKAVYELAYELNNRPGWVRIPLQGIRQILGKGE